MILQSLTQLYEDLAARGDISRPGCLFGSSIGTRWGKSCKMSMPTMTEWRSPGIPFR